MENKKGGFQNQNTNITPNIEGSDNETLSKHPHQQNTAPQHLRFLQYGLKIPTHPPHQHLQPNQAYQPVSSPLHTHIHLQNQQAQYQAAHRHLQPSPQYNNLNLQNLSLPPQKYSQQAQAPPPQKVNNQLSQSNQPYQTNQSPSTVPSTYNQMSPNAAQIWVPYQAPPIHYHHQKQAQKAEAQKPNQPSTPVSQSKPKELIERKKSSSSQIRSPSAKRPLEAPVTMQGWLHKQGSEGLMLWKKRWFVLSDYCLFYYKGMEEDKLLGSILLPSYKVSICRPEEKISKKYAFKCEHTNMRTYVLAADSQELMMQWVRVLNLATLMQSPNEKEQVLIASESSSHQQTHSVDNSESSSTQQFAKQSFKSSPAQTQSPSSTIEASSSQSQQDQPSGHQPLYANAPPKPRRLNDGFSSPSPDILERFNPQYLEPTYGSRPVTKSPSIYGQNLPSTQPEYYQFRPTDNVREYLFTPTGELHHIHTTERRTPETYGRSKLHEFPHTHHQHQHSHQHQHQHPHHHPTDYEDVYDEQSRYKRPMSPIAYTHVVKKNNIPSNVAPVYRAYTPVDMIGPVENPHYVPPQYRKVPVSTIARPHSADFLEYEINHRQPNSLAARQQPRPKSSLDINRNTNDSDNYFYSEEQYANKMRKSAQYLQRMPARAPSTPTTEVINTKTAPIRRYVENENTFPLMRSSTQPINFNNLLISDPIDHQPVRSRSVLSEGSLSKEIDMDRECSPEYPMRDMYNANMKNRDYDPFTRSASARLAQATPQLIHPDERSMLRDGDRKREESMRRLLEWKQRMLQSPLNRKIQVNRAYHGKPEPYNLHHDSGYSTQNHLRRGDGQANERQSRSNIPQYTSYSSDDEASGSISINTRDLPRINSRDNTFPRAIPAKKIWTPNTQIDPRPLTATYRNPEKEQFVNRNTANVYMNRTSSHPDLDPETRKENWPISEKMNVSAGELLGRTHEELVLLLIQLRRRSAQTLQAIENCYNEIDTVQAQLQAMSDQARRMENLQKLEQIKNHLLELEKQYEKGKPLVNLVDNMVKLGSLYRVPTDRTNYPPNIRDRIQFNQQIQERRLLSEEKRDWDRVNPDHFHLQDKVQQLYQLDRLIHEESKQLQNLQQDKEDIEHALGGLRRRLIKGLNDPAEIEHARQQQIMLENELSRVHLMLAQNSKKLEETVAGNARLEQELLVLKQKLQTSKQQRSSQQYSNAGDSLTCTMDNSVALESDLQRVQKKIGDLQKQRQELSIQVKQLTDRSSSSCQQKTAAASLQNSQCNKKKIPSLWRETDLDTMSTVDHGDSSENSTSVNSSTTPLYINTDMKQLGETDFYGSRSLRSNDSTSDTTSINSSVPQEKQEIKTVRIIKRESERRQRDREKSATVPRSETLIEEDDSSQCSSVLFRPTPLQKVQSAASIPPSVYEDNVKRDNLVSPNCVSSPNLPQCFERDVTSSTDVSTDKSPELSPVFKSEAARQIITEMSDQDMPKQQYNRRAIPKEKRRHYTAPHNHLMKSLNQLPTDNSAFDRMVLSTRRARDDLDMERALRQRIDAPDVVRSTLSNKELKYNENTIDNILGTPNKINIPERYIPEQLPQLSAEEQEYRLRKVESIKKMLSDTAIISTSSTNLNADDKEAEDTSSNIMNKATTKMIEEKKQREHLLQLNQILAKQVMEMSKIVAGANNADEKN